MGKVRIIRLSRATAMARRAAILVNGEKIGEVGNNSTFEFDAPAGEVRIQARMDWIKSSPLAVQVGASTTHAFELDLPKLWDIGRAFMVPFSGDALFKFKAVDN